MKPTAVPSVFPACPAYLSTPKPQARATKAATSEARFQQENDRLDELEMEMLMEDKVENSEELYSKLSKERLPTGFILQKSPKVTLLKLLPTDKGVDVQASIEIEENCSFKMFFNHVEIDTINVIQIVPTEKIQSVSDAQNIAAYLGSKEDLYEEEVFKNILSQLEEFLQKCDPDSPQTGKLSFLTEQFSLLFKPPKQRRYSPGFLAMCLLWQNTSSGLYEQMQRDCVLTLPGSRHLRNISSSVTVDCGLPSSTVKYLQARIKQLTPRQRNVVLMIDEVYSAQKVEFVRGKFLGNENNQATKTVLTFMIKSLASPYQDVVALIPTVNLNADNLHQHFMNVLKTITPIGFNVVIVSTDNHTANRKFFTQKLCNGSLKTSIPHPMDETKQLFLSFDAVHNFKNVYNNFINKEYFVCPSLGSGPPMRPNFAHIKEIHHKEAGQAVKMAHKLTQKAMNPTAIEKTNVKLADSGAYY